MGGGCRASTSGSYLLLYIRAPSVADQEQHIIPPRVLAPFGTQSPLFLLLSSSAAFCRRDAPRYRILHALQCRAASNPVILLMRPEQLQDTNSGVGPVMSTITNEKSALFSHTPPPSSPAPTPTHDRRISAQPRGQPRTTHTTHPSTCLPLSLSPCPPSSPYPGTSEAPPPTVCVSHTASPHCLCTSAGFPALPLGPAQFRKVGARF